MGFKVVQKRNSNYDKYIVLYYQGDISFGGKVSVTNKKLIESIIEKNGFKGKKSEKIEVTIQEKGNLITIILLGVGTKENYSSEVLRQTLYGALKQETGKIIITSRDKELLLTDAVSEVTNYLNYSFDKYKGNKSKKKIEIDLLKEGEEEIGLEGTILGEAVCLTRDLINEPANIICPETLAIVVDSLGKKHGFEVEILEEKEIEKLGMDSYLAVARAAEKRPRLIVMRHTGDSENPDEKIGLVGKGLTYDTGGLSLKSSDGMIEMKSDMGGAATVIGAFVAAVRTKTKKNIIGVIAACENSIGGNAYRPGDIISSMNGKTIEVTNTDAEGRLTLVDAITYSIREEGVTEIIDVATLTGGVIVALGFDATGVFTNTDRMYENIEKVSNEYGEDVWRLPLFDHYKKLIKSDVADLINSGGRWASAASAAKFLEEFVENKPWMHLDIAGTAYSTKAENYYPKGATGKMVRALYKYLKV